MAANNYGYGGFAHGGTQYNNQYSASAPNTGYAGTQGQQYPSAGSAQSQSYGAGGGNDQYNSMLSGYTRPNQASGQQQSQQSYYGQTQNYSAPVGAPAKPTPPRPAASSTAYPTYSANTAGSTGSSYAGFTQPAAAPSGQAANKSFTNYDQAVYNAVTAYAQGGTGGGRGGSQGLGFKKAGGNRMKGPRPPPKPQTLHYCDVCKISCAGPQTYKEHLEGQKHKKKEAAAKVGAPVVSKGAPPGLRCELCDVTCTGNDAYAAHIRGAKHQKVLKLHTKLGKPIPSDSPTVVAPAGTGNVSTNNSNVATALKPVAKNTSAPSANNNAGVVSGTNVSKANPPKINFIGPKADFDRYGGAQPNNAGASIATNNGNSSITSDFTTPVPGLVTTPATLTNPATTTAVNVSQQQSEAAKDALYMEKDIQPVGQDYIEEIRSEDNKIVSFNCKLCECRFNDPNAKEMHMKGRRHRLQYKKKVNPDLIVDVKPSSRQKKIEDRRANRGTAAGRRAQVPSEAFPRGPPVPLLPPGGPRGFGPGGPTAYHSPPAPLFYIPPLMRRNDTPEDLYVMSKHSEIYPQEDELQAIQKIVSSTEKALKFVSDQFADTDAKKANGIKEEPGTEPAKQSEADLQAHRILKGVMRVGHLAKGLLLKGDRTVELVVLCSVKPTLSMLNRISDSLPDQLQSVAPEEKYEVLRDVANASVVVASTLEPKIEVVVTLTSPLLRASTAPGEATANQVKDDPDLLDKEKCLDALAALRHAKWFQARATSLQSCVILIRIFRDICLRCPEWTSFPCWAIELLTEKVIQSVGVPVSPGDGFRLILEALSSGILLSSGLGLQDPCEKEPVDALRTMNEQERNDVTAFGQRALRLVTFRRIHEVLGVPVLERFTKKAENSRKRRRNESAAGEGDEGETGADGKKDKKEEVPPAEASTPIVNPHAEDGSLESLSKGQIS